jgi:hypothetical protein
MPLARAWCIDVNLQGPGCVQSIEAVKKGLEKTTWVTDEDKTTTGPDFTIVVMDPPKV